MLRTMKEKVVIASTQGTIYASFYFLSSPLQALVLVIRKGRIMFLSVEEKINERQKHTGAS